jgi:D-lyxose ketol-isomerase
MENKYPKTYAQKIMYMLENQKSPVHMHLSKMEDIINNGGGNIEIKVWKADSYNKLSPEGFDVSIDGKSLSVPAGAKIKLTPGQSIAIPPKTFHQFWAEPGKGPVLSMEVSSVCNDLSDNYWLENGERFPDLDEDAPARFVLCNEY